MSLNPPLFQPQDSDDLVTKAELDALSERRIQLVGDAPAPVTNYTAWIFAITALATSIVAYVFIAELRSIPVPTFGIIALAIVMFFYLVPVLRAMLVLARNDWTALQAIRQRLANDPITVIDVWNKALSLRIGSSARYWILGLCSSSELDRPDLQAIAEAASSEQQRPKSAANLFLLLSLTATIFGLFEVIWGLRKVLFNAGQSPETTQQRIFEALPNMATAFLGTAVGILLSVVYTWLAGMVNREIDELESATERFAILELAPALLPRAPERILETLQQSIDLILKGQRALQQYQAEITKSVESLSTSADQLRKDSEKAFADYAQATDEALKSSRRLLQQTDTAMQKSGDRLREATNDVSKHATDVVNVLAQTATALQKVLVDNVAPASGELKAAADKIHGSLATVEQAVKTTPATVSGLSQNVSQLNTTLGGLGAVTTELRNLEAELKRSSQTISPYAASLASLPKQDVYVALMQTLSNVTTQLAATTQALSRLESTLLRTELPRVQ